MNVNSVNHIHNGYHPKQDIPAIETTIQPAENVEKPTTGDVAVPVENADSETKQKGVIRNLLAGHFKGVADIRLRINFNDEIVALEQKALETATEEGVSNLSQTLNSEVSSFLANSEIDQETQDLLTESYNSFTSALTQTSNSDKSALISDIQSAFDAFVTSATPVVAEPEEGIITPPTDEIETTDMPIAASLIQTVETPVETQIETPSESIYDQFLTSLIETFNIELAKLESSLTNISVLPEISEPSGNGKAFDKFMAIYNDIRGIGDAVGATETEIIETPEEAVSLPIEPITPVVPSEDMENLEVEIMA